jgi:hypothetical protein
LPSRLFFQNGAETHDGVLKGFLKFVPTKPNGQISIGFEKVSLKMSDKAQIFFKMFDKKNSTRQIPVLPGKNQNKKIQFSDEFSVRA